MENYRNLTIGQLHYNIKRLKIANASIVADFNAFPFGGNPSKTIGELEEEFENNSKELNRNEIELQKRVSQIKIEL